MANDKETFEKQAQELLDFAIAGNRIVKARNAARPYRMLAEAYYIAALNSMDDWKIQLGPCDDVVHAGECCWQTKTITLDPRHLTSDDRAHEIVLHELAHALQIVHHGTAHNAVLEELKRQHPRLLSEQAERSKSQ